MRKAIQAVPFLLSFTWALALPAQSIPDPEPGRRFHPSIGINWNANRLHDGRVAGKGRYIWSVFPGLEFGFRLEMGRVRNWEWDYRNHLLGELVVRELAALAGAESIYRNFTDRTVTSGFGGRLELRRHLWERGSHRLQMGWLVSDRFIGGADWPGGIGDAGFRLSTGLSGIWTRTDAMGHQLSLRGAASVSIFDKWFRDDMPDRNARVPQISFWDTELNWRYPSGVWLGGAATISLPLGVDTGPSMRLAFRLGYEF
jgi:hypothetical protein